MHCLHCLLLWLEFYMQTQLKPFRLEVCQVLRLESDVVVVQSSSSSYVPERVRGDRKEWGEDLFPLSSYLFLNRGE